MEWSVMEFLTLEQIGEVMLMRAGKIPDGSNKAEWEFVPHAQMDGLGVFVEMLARYEGYAAPPPKAFATTPPFKKRMKAFADTWKRQQASRNRKPIQWKQFNRDAIPSIPQAIAYTVLTEAETKKVFKGSAIGSNSRLLWALDRAIANTLAEPAPDHLWLMPVNFRGAPRSEGRTNPMSMIAIEFAESAGPKDVQKAILGRFREGAHWGSWDWMWICEYLGHSFVRKATLAYHARKGWPFYGIFSNLGDMTVADRKTKYAFVGVPPVCRAYPISALSAGWGGKLTLTIQAHSALSTKQEDAQGWVESWREHLLRGL